MLVKSPLKYTGGKFKLLLQLLPLMPERINTFYDIFAGGCNVGVNIKNADNIICNEIIPEVVEFMKILQSYPTDLLLSTINDFLRKYNFLSQEAKTMKALDRKLHNEKNFYLMRDYYNTERHTLKDYERSMLLFSLIMHGFNTQIRFGKNRKYNIPAGTAWFTDKIKEDFYNFASLIQSKNIVFENKDFRDTLIDDFQEGDYIYADPPYLLTHAPYNTAWCEEQEDNLYVMLEQLDKKGIYFGLSNVVEAKGKENTKLKKWIHKNNYNFYFPDIHYKSSCYNKKEAHRKEEDMEVFVTNLKK